MQDKVPSQGIQVVRQNAPPMPVTIGKAVLEAISKISGAQATGKGEDTDTARKFQYVSINDVIEAAHQVLVEVGLAAVPIEVEYSDQLVTTPLNAHALSANYAYKFRLIAKDGTSWVDELDTRHVTLLLPVDGKGAGKAQSLATRDYLKGLLRIRTVEPDDEGLQNKENGVEKQPRETERIPPKNTILFDFGIGPEYLSAQALETRFKEVVAPLAFAQRKQWEAANATALRELYDQAGPIWLRVKAALDLDEKKGKRGA